ncbi:MAG: hypothetical protein H0W55_04650 [Actinobacteria bacterium]|nr:hypothetical protein [Actinomycetota bacterium]MDQ3532586.1 hypothetical protein [Actinomycetota bacterium]
MTKSLGRKLALILAVMALVVLWAAPVPAISSAANQDASGKLDLWFVTAGKANRNGIGRFALGTEKRLRCRYLRSSKDRSLKWSFDDGRDGDFDLVGKFVCTRGHLLFHLRGTQTHNVYEPIEPKKGRKTLLVRVPLDLAELRARHLSVVAKSKDGQSPGCSEPCRDRLPESGLFDVY